MNIAVIGSKHNIAKVQAVAEELEQQGHHVTVITSLPDASSLATATSYSHGKPSAAFLPSLDQFKEQTAKSDALLVINTSHHGIAHFISENAEVAIIYSFILGKKIYLYNPVPNVPHASDYDQVKPVILRGDLTKIN